MKNSEKFQLVFGFNPNKLHNDSDEEFLNWCNKDYVTPRNLCLLTCIECKQNFAAAPYHHEKDEFGIDIYHYKCPFCGNKNNVNYYCSWR